MLAATGGHVAVLKLLLSSRAPVDEVAFDGNTALTLAAELGHVDVVKQLLHHGAAVNRNGVAAPLAAAAQRGHLEVLNLLLGKGAEIDATDEDGDTALHEAVYNGHTDAVRVLVERTPSADLNRQNQHGWTPLMAAAQRDHIVIVDFLLGKGASVALKTEEGRTALHIGAEEGRADVLRSLVRRGAEVDAVDEEGWTPLMKAVYRGHKECVKFLLGKGACLQLKNKKGKTVSQVAMSNSRMDISALLTESHSQNPRPSQRQRTQ